MATTLRNTGTHFRFDGDDQLWHAKVRMQKQDGTGITIEEFVTALATLAELLAWLDVLFAGMNAQPETHVSGT